MSYIKQLDSIRAIAVLLVIVHHWTPVRNPLHAYTSVFNGVNIFFVLSGFLITHILLQHRNIADQRGLPKSITIKNFFVRRVLRIFPIYYLLIFVLLLFAHTTGTTIRENFIYYATYTVNIHFFLVQRWDGMLSHLWSLSVEEQFYLFWPWLMLFVRKNWILPVIILSIIAGILSQLLLPNGRLLTFSCLDAFGAGAFLAWALVYDPKLLVRTKLLWALLALVGLSGKLWLLSGYYMPIPTRTLTAFLVIWAILYAVKNQKQYLLFDLILNNRILIFIGKISYGIYLYHLIIPHYTRDLLYDLNHLLPSAISKYHIYLYRAENFMLVLALSYLSWKLIEQPTLRLKKRFGYQKQALSDITVSAARPMVEKNVLK